MQITIPAGMHVSHAAALLAAAVTQGDQAEMTFNGIRIVAHAGDNAEKILRDYDAEIARRRAAYLASPEYATYAAERAATVARLAAQRDALMSALDSLDFTNDVAVLEWLRALQEPSDHVCVVIDRKRILTAFAAHGHQPNAHCGPDYREGDRNSEYRYLVGQALDGIREIGAIHGVYHHFHRKWKESHLRD